jgi:hypothetical protein
MFRNPAEDDGFSRAIKIHSTAFFGGEVKPSTLGGILNILSGMKRDRLLVGKIHGCFSPSLSWFAIRCVLIGLFTNEL